MRDWRKLVQERLAVQGQNNAIDESVVQELAEHLEDLDTESRGSSLTQDEELRRIERRVGDWLALRQGIEGMRQEGDVQERVKQFWLPSLVTLLVGWGILATLIWAGVHPYMTHPGNPEGLFLYLPWLVALPFVGALGAYIARRAKSQSWKVYVAGAFPAVAMFMVFLLILPWAFVVNPQVAPGLKATSIMANMVSWVVLPGIALGLGVAMQGMGQRRRPAS